ncbi:MAG: MBL fold metallo-hydrolase [Clostridia bacterium]|nr:MBL fold metallo-hydrolase [Clostridia bacterium]
MNFSVCVLSSGSKGNCTYITDGTTKILLDAGICCRDIESGLNDIGENIASLDGILITHEHCDHIRGLKTLTKKSDIPVYSNYKTLNAIDYAMATSTKRYAREDFDSGFYIKSIFVQPFRISHDAVYPVGYTLNRGSSKITSVTDLGIVSPNILANAKGSDIVILESNHDEEMLKRGKYPEMLKRRIEGKLGHLSNNTAAQFARDLVQSGTKQLILAHLSEENNLPALALEAVCSSIVSLGAVIDKDVTVEIAYQRSRTALHNC